MKNRLLYTLALLFACLQTFAQTYTYDNLNRLKTVVYGNGVTVTYGYDALGNRTKKEVKGAGEPAIDPNGITYTFEDGTLEGWTTIDADGDGYNWDITSSGLIAHNGSDYAVYSASYINDVGALTPDNYLVSPKVKLGSTFSFFAVAQDAAYPSEHFGVFVSTTGKNAEDFQKVREWTLTKARLNRKGSAPQKVQGNWYQYIVDMSAFKGEEGYVAIRHFDSTDMYYMLVDDISFGTPANPDVKPELVVAPEGLETKTWSLSCSTYEGDISGKELQIGVATTDEGAKEMYIQGLCKYLPEAWVKGVVDGKNATVTFATGQFYGTFEDEDTDYDLFFVGYDYDAEEIADVVFSLNEKDNIMTTDLMILLNSKKNSISYYDYYYNVVISLTKDSILGDVNGDGKVDITDAIMIVYHSLGLEQEGFNASVADVNGDRKIDITDAIIVVYKSLGAE